MYEVPVHTAQASLSHGEVSPFIFGRVDLTAYSSGLRTSRNAFIRTEGSWSNRQGFEYCDTSITATPYGSVLIPFTFNVGQSYIIEFGAETLQVLSGGEPVVGMSGSTPYAQGDLALLRYSQSADTLTIVHPNYQPYEFKRTSASTFTFLKAVYTMGPFLQQNPDGVTFVYASAQTGTVTLTSTWVSANGQPQGVAGAGFFNANHVGALFQLTQQDLSQVLPWEPQTRVNAAAGYITGILGILCRSNGKNYKCVGYPGYGGSNNAIAIYTGTIAPSHSQGTVADGSGMTPPNQGASPSINAAGVDWQYTDSGFGTVLITEYISPTQVIGVVQPNYTGGPGVLPIAVVGGPVADTVGPWNFTGDGSTVSFALTSGSSSTQFDPNKFYVQVGGGYVNPALYAISGTNIVLGTAPAAGKAIVVKQITALGQTTYWAFGAFSPDQGYPSTVSYVPDRLVLAATIAQPVGVFGSQTSIYHNFGVSNPVVNSDSFAVFLNARQLNRISDLLPLQDLLIGTANIMWRLWPGNQGNALGPLYIEGTPQAFLGESPNVAGVLYGDSALYAIYGGRRIRDLIYQFQFDKYVGSELTAYSRHLIPYGVQIIKMAYAPDPWGQVYVLRSDGILLTCTYVREQQMIAWSRWDTQGTIEDIAVIPEENSFALYVITNRTINGATVRYIERLSQWETETIYDYQFMDCSQTYDGRNTSTNTMKLTGGTTWLSGDVGRLTCSGANGWVNFQTTDAGYGNQIQLFDADGNLARVLITAYVSATVATVRFVDPIPADLQGIATLTWAVAVKNFTGATQLAGATVAVIADSNVIAGTNGVPIISVSLTGTFKLQTPAAVVCVGLQYFSDLETLALNQQGAETLREKAKGTPAVYLDVTGGRGLLTGTDFVNMFPIKERAFEPYLDSTELQEGVIRSMVYSDFDPEAHICVRQAYPLPVTIRMVIPAINVGDPSI